MILYEELIGKSIIEVWLTHEVLIVLINIIQTTPHKKRARNPKIKMAIFTFIIIKIGANNLKSVVILR